ncbi:MAG: carboxypeptidase regulatory-like domain-containing protein [Dehalococcoidia bacterium]
MDSKIFRRSWIIAAGILALALVFSLTAIAAGGGGEPPGQARVVSVLGVVQVQGQDVFVDVLVLVRPGQDPKAAAQAGLESQGARPLKEAELGSGGGFTLIGPKWDEFLDADPTTVVVQHYNSDSEPLSAGTALTSSQALWKVGGTQVDLALGATTRCPSLIRQCPGPQVFDTFNDVAWLNLGISRGFVILGAVLFADSNLTGPEADMALSTNNRIDWVDDDKAEDPNVDVIAVILHELGHVLGLGHSADPLAVMATPYTNPPERKLADDDKEGVTFLYDSNKLGSVTGTVLDGDGNGIQDATVVLEGTGLSENTAEDGTYTISGVPDPVTYTVTASKGGFESDTKDRLLVDVSGGGEVANFTLTAVDGGEEENGGPPPCKGWRRNTPECQ